MPLRYRTSLHVRSCEGRYRLLDWSDLETPSLRRLTTVLMHHQMSRRIAGSCRPGPHQFVSGGLQKHPHRTPPAKTRNQCCLRCIPCAPRHPPYSLYLTPIVLQSHGAQTAISPLDFDSRRRCIINSPDAQSWVLAVESSRR